MVPVILRRMVALVVVMGLSLATVAGATAAPAPRMSAELTCLRDGGAQVTFTVTNTGRSTILVEDLHFYLSAVRQHGAEGVGAVFVTPAPDFAVVPAGQSRTITIGFGDFREEGEPPPDLSGQRLVLGTDVFLDGRNQPLTRHFSFPACNT